MSSPHKCGQENGYSAFNTVTVAFSQIFWALPPFFQIHRTRPPLLSFLEDSSSCWDTNLTYVSHVRKDFHPRTFLQVLLTFRALCSAFTIYWQSPQTFYCPQTGLWPNILFGPLPLQLLAQKINFQYESECYEYSLNFVGEIEGRGKKKKNSWTCYFIRLN